MGIYKGLIITLVLLCGTCLNSQGNTTQNCTRTNLKSATGHVNSDNFPSSLLPNTCNFWFFRGTPGEVFTLSLSTLDLPQSSARDDCEDNYLIIGPVPKVKLCGNSSQPYIKRFDTLYDYLWIQFRTGPYPMGTGFFLYYIAGPQPATLCSENQYLCTNGKCILGIWLCNGYDECGDNSDEENCETPNYEDRSSLRNFYRTPALNHTTPLTRYDEAQGDIDENPLYQPDERTTTLGCQRLWVLSGREGNFSMPPYPYRVSDIRDACWIIESSDPTSFISLEFPVFDLWSNQRVEVYDGQNDRAPRLAQFVGSTHTVVSSSNVLLVKFFAGYSLDMQNHVMWKAFVAHYFMQETCELGKISCGPDDNRCYTQDQTCDGIWDCPLSGRDEAGCYGCPASMFSCYQFGDHQSCYSRQDRCSGVNICSSYADEKNCNKEQCSSEKNLFLCANNRCIPSGFHCDGTDDCGDDSDEEDCRLGGARKVIVAAVVGSLISSLLLVLALGCACKVYALRTNEHPRSSRFDTPLSRLQAEMFRRRAPPPPYHEAMLTSRPYDEAVREFMAQSDVVHLVQEQPGASGARSQTHVSGDLNSGNACDSGRDSEDLAIQNLISLMDVSDEASSASSVLPTRETRPRLQLLMLDDSSDSEAEYTDHRNLAYEESVQMGLADPSRGHQAHCHLSEERESLHLGGECSSEDSASAILADTCTENQPVVGKGGKDSSDITAVATSGQGRDEDKETNESDTDSVCILCLDSPSYDDDGSDTRCLLEDV